MPQGSNLTEEHQKAAAKIPPYFSREDISEEEKQAARIKGGETGGRKRKYIKGTKVPIEGLNDVLEGLSEVIGNLKEMDVTPANMNSLIRAWQVASSCFTEREDRERLQTELDELREALGLDD